MESLGSNITQGLDDIVSGLTSLKDNFLQGLTDLGTFLIDSIKALFLPSEGYLENEVTELRSRFAFADSIISSASSLIDTITSAASNTLEPPAIVMDLDIRGTTKAVTVIDLAWYKPYKEYCDMVLSGIIWVFFIWRLFVHLPGIISGTVGAVGSAASDAPDTLKLEGPK